MPCPIVTGASPQLARAFYPSNAPLFFASSCRRRCTITAKFMHSAVHRFRIGIFAVLGVSGSLSCKSGMPATPLTIAIQQSPCAPTIGRDNAC